MDEKERRKSLRTKIIVYVILRVIVLALLVRAVITANWHEVLYCVLTLVLFIVPSIVEKQMKIELPSGLEIVVLLFIFAGEILGEIGQFFHRVATWDLMLHTVNGFLMAAIGIALIDVLNKSPKINMSMSPFFVAFVAFCFSMTIGVLWEFGEYSMDMLVGSDTQKDTVVSYVNTDIFSPQGQKVITRIEDIDQTVIYGYSGGEETQLVIEGGYLDVGLHDTIEDMFVNLIGAAVFSIIGALFIKSRGKGQVAGAFIPRFLTDEEAEEAQRQKKNMLREMAKVGRRSKEDDPAGDSSAGGNGDQGEGG